MRALAVLALLLVACTPQVLERPNPATPTAWDVPLTKPPAAVIGSSLPITRWEPADACQFQDTLPDVAGLEIFDRLAIICDSPGIITVYTTGRVVGRYVSTPRARPP